MSSSSTYVASKNDFFLPRSISVKKKHSLTSPPTPAALLFTSPRNKNLKSISTTQTHRLITKQQHQSSGSTWGGLGGGGGGASGLTGSLTDRSLKSPSQNSQQNQFSSMLHTRIPSSGSIQIISDQLISPRQQFVSQLNSPKKEPYKFGDYIENYIALNPLFSAPEQLLSKAEYIPIDVKQSLLTMGLIASSRSGYYSSQTNESNTTNNVTFEVKNMLFSALDRLQKEVLRKASDNFSDQLIKDSISILNEVVPFIVRKLSESDVQLARFCEGLFKFYVLFMEGILQRINHKIKQECSAKLAEFNNINHKLRAQIDELTVEVEQLQQFNTSEKATANQVETKLKEEIVHLKTELFEIQGSIADLSNLDFAPKQLEKMAGTTRKMTDMLRLETVASEKSGLLAENQLLQLSNALLAASRKRIDGAQVQTKHFGMFTAHHTNLTSRLFGEHPFSPCLLYIGFQGEGALEQDDSSSNRIDAIAMKTLLLEYFTKCLPNIHYETVNPAEAFVEYLRKEIYPGSFDKACIALKQVLNYLKDTQSKDPTSAYFSSLFGILNECFPSKESIATQINLIKKLQQLYDEQRIKKASIVIPEKPQSMSSSSASLTNLDFHSQNQVSSLSGSMKKIRTDQVSMLIPSMIDDIEETPTEMPLESWVIEEIPFSIIVASFPNISEDSLKTKLITTNVTPSMFLHKALSLSMRNQRFEVDDILAQITQKIEEQESLQEKLRSQAIERAAEKFKLKYTAVLANVIYFYNEEVMYKKKVSQVGQVELTQKEFTIVVQKAVKNLLDLQTLHSYPFVLAEGTKKEIADVDLDESNMSMMLSSQVQQKNSKKAMMRTFKKIQIQHSFSKSSFDNSIMSDRQSSTPIMRRDSRQFKQQPSLAESSSKFSKFKK